MKGPSLLLRDRAENNGLPVTACGKLGDHDTVPDDAVSTNALEPLQKAFSLAREGRIQAARDQLQVDAKDQLRSQPLACRQALYIIDWYEQAREGRFGVGLLEAVEALSQLQPRLPATCPTTAILRSAAGFSMGIVGNVETGLQWIGQALETAKVSGDIDLLRTALANRGAVLQMAGDFERGEQTMREALTHCGNETSVLRCNTLNNLAFARLTWARSLERENPQRLALAASALESAREAEILANRLSLVRHRCWALGSAGSALAMMNRPTEAEALFRQALPEAPINPRVHVVVLTGLASLLTGQARHAEARALLEEAWPLAPADLLDSTLDLVLEARVKLELAASDAVAAALWSDRRYKRLEQQYRHRLSYALQQVERLSSMERDRTAEREREQTNLQRLRQHERESMLRDLHDGFGSQLVSARLAAERGALNQSEMVEILQDCISDLYLVVDTITNEEGRLDAALRHLRNRLNSRLQGLGVELDWQLALGEAPALGYARLVQALRIVQEALTNALRHSRATHIEVSSRWDDSLGFQIAVTDNGIGVPVAPREGQGLRSMRSRAAGLGGQLRIGPGNPGTRVELRFPAQA